MVLLSYGLLSVVFSAVPSDSARLPSWTKKPHAVVSALKALLEAVYAAPHGAAAAVTAGNVARLWEAYAQGGVKLVTLSAGRTGQSTYPARIQRATKNFMIFVIAHALDQQRRWGGVETA